MAKVKKVSDVKAKGKKSKPAKAPTEAKAKKKPGMYK